jgi:hypothetical protein
LRQLSGPLRRLADFLRLDPDLLAVATAVSGAEAPAGPQAEELAAWVGQLPPAEKDALLVRLMQGEAVSLPGELLQRFRKDQARKLVRKDRGKAAMARRTVGELLEARDRQAEERRRRAAERAAREQARRAREEAAARARHLDRQAGREDELWRQVEAAIQTRQPKEYDRAVELLKDLRDLAERSGTGAAVAKRIGELRARHGSKPTLMQRLDRAGFPK